MGRYYSKANPEMVVKYKNTLKTLLKKICAICEKHNVKYGIDCGTVLGFYRDGDICKNDGDMDMYILAETITMPFMDDLRPLMRDVEGKQTMSYKYIQSSFEKSKFIIPMYIKCEDKSHGYFSEKTPQYPGIDIFIMAKLGQERYCKMHRTFWIRHSVQILDDIAPFTCPQGTFMTTKHIDALMRIYYDDNYMIPQDGFHDEMRSLKYCYWGLVDKTDVGSIVINFATGEVRDDKNISLNNQKLLGVIDENENPTDLNLLPYFDPNHWDEMKHIMRPFLPVLRHRMIDWNLVYGTREKKSALVRKMWKYMDDKQKEQYKYLYNETY